jgi:tetratricopeptide (TPR) repeat protein
VKRIFIRILPVFIVILIETPVLPQEIPAEAQKHYEKAVEYGKKGDYKKAIEEFLFAFDYYKSASILFNVAKTYEKIGDLENAIIHYRRYLELKPDAEDRDLVTSKIQDFKKKLSEHKTEISFITVPEKAKIFIDCVTPECMYVAPASKWLGFGEHTVRIEAQEYIAKELKLNVLKGKEQTISVELNRIKQEPVVKAPVKVPEKKPEPQKKPETAPVVEKKTEGWSMKTWGYISLGTGGAFTVLGVTMYFLGMSELNDANSKYRDQPDKKDAYNSAYDSAMIKRTVGFVGLGLGVAGLAAGTALILLDSGNSGANQASLNAVPVFSPNGFGVMGIF